MKKLLRKKQPTVAEYFKSESQRKKTSRLAFIHGSKRLVAVITILVIASGVAGIAIIQKQRSSSAAVARVGVSFSKSDAPVNIANWTLTNTSNNAGLTIQSKDSNGFSLGFYAGSPGRFEYGTGYRVCWNIGLGASASHPNLQYHNVRFTYRTNEAGTNGVAVYMNGQQMGLTEDSKLNGTPGTPHEAGGLFDKSIVANLGSAAPGNIVSFCNVKIGGSTAYFNADRVVSVYAYSFGASFDQEQDVEIIGTVADSAGKGIAGVKISNCQIYPAATTDSQGLFRFYVRKGSGYCVRTQEGLSTSIYSGVKATNTNHPPLSSDGASYEGQVANARGTNYDFKATLKPVAAAPIEIIGTVTDNSGAAKPIPGVKIYDCNSSNAAFTTDSNGMFRLLIPKGDDFCVRTGEGLSTSIYSGVKATNTNHKPFSPDGASYESQIASARGTNYDFKATLKPVAAAPTVANCSNTGSGQPTLVEGEQASCGGGANVANDGAASGGKAALLDKDGGYVEYTFTAPETGNYQAVAKMRGQTAAGKAYFEFKKLNPGAASTTMSESGKVIAAGSNYTNYTPRSTASGTPALVQTLTQGQQVMIRVQQQGSSNIVVDQLILTKEVPPASSGGSTGGTTPTTPTVVSCSNTGSGQPTLVEGEQALCKNGAIVGNDGAASGGKAALLDKDGGSVEYVFTAPEAGNYQAAARMRGQVSAAKVYFEFKKLNPGAASETLSETQKSIASGSTYTSYTPRSTAAGNPALVHTLAKGQQVIILVKQQGSAKAVVDQLILTKEVAPSGSGNSGSGGSTTTPDSPSTCGSNNFAEAENGIRRPTGAKNTAVANDPLVPAVRSAVLLSQDSYVECTLTAPKTGRFTFGAKIRSSDYKNIKADAKISMAGVGAVASKNVETPKGQVYGLVRFAEVANYRQMNKDQKIVVRVTFINDASGNDGDRNLWVDSMMLVEIPQDSSSGSGNTGNNPPILQPCSKETTVTEAEDGTLSASGAQVQSDNSASGKSMVRISNNNGYTQCTLRAPSDGSYILGATVKSDNRAGAGRAVAVLSMAGNNAGTQTDEQDASGTYDKVRMRVNDATRRKMKAGELVVVRVGIKNASSNAVTKRNLLVDRIELIKAPDAPTTTNTPATPGSESVVIPTTEATSGAEVTQYDSATGTLIKYVQAEKAKYQGGAFYDPIASEQQAVRLFSNKNYVEYNLYFPETDSYSLDFAARSENYKNVTANARIVLDGKKLFGNDIKLQSSPNYKYYTSEKRVSITKGNHTFRVEYTNDLRGADGDRNLIVDYLRIRGSKRIIPAVEAPPTPTGTNYTFVPIAPDTTIIEAERAQSCIMKKATIPCDRLAIGDGAAYGGQGLVLNYTNDSVEGEFTVPTTGTYAVSALLRSMDFDGSAKADIYGAGSKVKAGFIPDSDNYSSYAFATNSLKQGSKYKIKIVFTNDQCGKTGTPCNASTDRNLLVDQLRLRLIEAAPVSTPAPETPPPTQPSTPPTQTTPTPVTPGEVAGGLITNLFTKAGWRHKIPASEPNHAQSSAMASAFVKLSKNAGTENSPLMYVGKTSDPVQTIAGKKFYWPSNANPSSGPDATVEVLNPITPDGLQNRIARKYEDKIYGGSYTGVADAIGDGFPYAGNGTAWGLMSSSAVVTPQELAAGYIPHAIGVAIGTNVLSPSKFMAPARSSEHKATGSIISMGARFQITTPMDQINSELERNFSGEDLRVAKVLWTALHDYGFIARDGTGTNGSWIYIGGGNKSSMPSGQSWSQAFRKPTSLWSADKWRVPARSQY